MTAPVPETVYCISVPIGMPGPAIPQILNRTAASAGANGVFGSTAALACGKPSSISKLSDNDGGDQTN